MPSELEHDTLESPSAAQAPAGRAPKRSRPKPRLTGDGRLAEARERRRARRPSKDARPQGPRYSDISDTPERVPDPALDPWCVWDNDAIWSDGGGE